MKASGRHRWISYAIWACAVFLSLLALCGLALLLFSIGEKETYPLGSSLESLPYQIALFHLEEVSEDGDYAFLIDGVYHYYRITSVSERVGHAITSFFSFSFSLSPSFDYAPLSSVIGDGLRGSLLGFSCFCLAILLPFPVRYLPGKSLPKYLFFPLLAVCFLLAFLSPLFTSGFHLPLLFLGLGAFLFSLQLALKKEKVHAYFAYALFALGGCYLCFHGLSSLDEKNLTLSSILRLAIVKEDNHTYALSFFYVGLLSLLPFYVGTFLLLRKKHREGA